MFLCSYFITNNQFRYDKPEGQRVIVVPKNEAKYKTLYNLVKHRLLTLIGTTFKPGPKHICVYMYN